MVFQARFDEFAEDDVYFPGSKSVGATLEDLYVGVNCLHGLLKFGGAGGGFHQSVRDASKARGGQRMEISRDFERWNARYCQQPVRHNMHAIGNGIGWQKFPLAPGSSR